MSELRFDVTAQDRTSAQIERIKREIRDLTAEVNRFNKAGEAGWAEVAGRRISQLEGSLKSLQSGLNISIRDFERLATSSSASTYAISRFWKQMEAGNLDAAKAILTTNQLLERQVGHASRLGTVSRVSVQLPGTESGGSHVARQRELNEAFNAIEQSAGRGARAIREVGAASIAAADGSAILNREAKHVVAIMDSLAAGRRGQAVSSIGAAFRDAGLGAQVLLPGVAAIAAIMGGAALIRGAERFGEMAERIRAGASAAGMGVSQFSQLQGALQLVGMKGESADLALRHFAESISQAVADPTSRAAEAFKALGIAQNFIKENASNTEAVLQAVSQAWNTYADSAAKSETGTILFGRGVERILPLLGRTSVEVKNLENKATELGITLNDDESRALSETGQKVRELGLTIEGNAIRAFIAWKPVIDATTDSLSAVASAALKAIGAIGQAIQAAQRANVEAGIIIGGEGGGVITQGPRQLEPNEAAIPPASFGTAPREGTAFGAVRPEIKAVRRSTAVSDIQVEIAQARDLAAQRGGSLRQMTENETRAAIEVLKKYVNDANLNYIERNHLKAELARENVSLANKEASGAASAAKQAYLDFAGNERLKIQEARGDIGQITAIYNEWEAAAKTTYHQNLSELEKIEREKTAAVQRATQQRIQLLMQEAAAQEHILNDNVRRFEANMQAGTKIGLNAGGWPAKGGTKITEQQAYGFDIQELTKNAEEAKKILQSVLSESGISDKQRQEIQLKIKILDADTAVKQAQLEEKLVAAGENAAKKWVKPFVDAADKIGSALESAIGSALSGQKNIAQQLAKSIGVSLAQGIGAAISKGLASSLGATGGEGLGAFLGTKLLGLLPFAAGGYDVPAFADGGLSGGGLAILHPKEMVLPANLADTVRRASAGGGSSLSSTSNSASLNYSPTINAGGSGGRMSSSDFESMMRYHGDSMMEAARRMMRDGWRPGV